jgi:hypothetical protein
MGVTAMTNGDLCPTTPLRHKFPRQSAAWMAVRGQSSRNDTFRVYRCDACDAWHWYRIISLAAIKKEGTETTMPEATP